MLHHPLLVIELGFRLHLDLPPLMASMLRKLYLADLGWARQLHDFDPACCKRFFTLLCLFYKKRSQGWAKSWLDVKHIYAWVKENNERVYVKDRYAKAQQLKGDRDCTLGVKKKDQPRTADGSTKSSKSTFGLWLRGGRPHQPGLWRCRPRRIYPTL